MIILNKPSKTKEKRLINESYPKFYVFKNPLATQIYSDLFM